VCLRRPLVFLVVLTCWETRLSSRRYSTYFLFFLFWIIILSILPATMLGYYSTSASLMPSKIFSSSFRSIGSLLPIGRHLTSLRLAKTSNRSATKLICSFFFWTEVHAIRPVDSLRLHHDLSKVATHTPHSRACDTWVPLGPH
jgi:hypothetical protein